MTGKGIIQAMSSDQASKTTEVDWEWIVAEMCDPGLEQPPVGQTVEASPTDNAASEVQP